MAASFPGAVKSFAQQVDGVSTIDAVDVNAAYDEIEAIEDYLLGSGQGLNPYSVDTVDATPTTIYSVAPAANSVTLISGFVVAHRTGGEEGTANDQAAFQVVGLIKNNAGTLSIADIYGNSGLIVLVRDQIGWTVTWDESPTGTIVLQVTGAADNNITWQFVTSFAPVAGV